MNIRDLFVDYEENKEEIEKWLSVKGESKYLLYLKMIEELKIKTSWENVSHLYKYDKRLLFNLFKYISFFEEYLRVILVNELNLNLKKLERKCFGSLVRELKSMPTERINNYFEINFCNNIDLLSALRNRVCHSKIIIIEKYKKEIVAFYDLLPTKYKENYKKDINNCSKKLTIPKTISQIFLD